jgi:hypothetical protein
VSLIVNNEEQLLRALADTGASSSIILEAYTSPPFIKTDDCNTTTWSTMGGKFTTNKTGFVTFSLPEFNLKKQMYTSWAFHVDWTLIVYVPIVKYVKRQRRSIRSMGCSHSK